MVSAIPVRAVCGDRLHTSAKLVPIYQAAGAAGFLLKAIRS